MKSPPTAERLIQDNTNTLVDSDSEAAAEISGNQIQPEMSLRGASPASGCSVQEILLNKVGEINY